MILGRRIGEEGLGTARLYLKLGLRFNRSKLACLELRLGLEAADRLRP